MAALVASAIAVVEEPGRAHDLPLDVRGTAFQEAVLAGTLPRGARRERELRGAGRPCGQAGRGAGGGDGVRGEPGGDPHPLPPRPSR